MTPEDILAAIVMHSQRMAIGKPDPLVMAHNAERVGKAKPTNWRLIVARSTTAGAMTNRIEFWPSVLSADGKQTRSRSVFSISEVAADGVSGMPERNWQTLQCAVGMTGDARQAIFARLATIARQSQKRDRFWRKSIQRQPCCCGRSAAEDYALDLIALAMKELEQPWLMRTHRVKANWFGVSESTWYDRCAKPYDMLSSHLWSWYHAGIGHIQNRLNSRNLRRAQPKTADNSVT